MKLSSFLLIPKIQIHNANALSSPYTIGFPAMTAWLGAVHALERQLKKIALFEAVRFKSVAIINHHFDLQTHKGDGDYVYSIIGTGNPLKKDGKRPSFIEEARCHLTVSLLIEYSGIDKDDENELRESLETLLYSKIKMAGGSIFKYDQPLLKKVGKQADLKALMGQLMPGYCLIERRDLLQNTLQTEQNSLDALLDYLSIKQTCQKDKKDQISWTAERKTKGWIIPIATGFQGLTAPELAKSQRDADTPHCFAESIITLGEFIMPYRVKNIDHILWHTRADLDNNLYICQQNTPFINN